MFAKVTCPYCGDKQSVPESMRGKRVNCPNCQSPYMAGQSAPSAPSAEAHPAASPGNVSAGLAAGLPAPAPLARTMLAPLEEPIRYSCPRCSKSIESPRSMAGQKLHCPHCSQRLQVPAPPTPALPPLNKTILAQTDIQAPSPRPGQGSGTPPALPAQTDVDHAADDSDSRRQHCLECGRSLAARTDLLTCPKCGSIFCSSACYRDHNDFAHPRKRRGREYANSPEDATPGNGMAVTGMVLGIIGFVMAFIPCYGTLFGALLGILGAIFAAIGLSQASNDGAGRGMATTGLILSVLAIIWAPLWYFIIFASLAQGAGWFRF